MRVDGRIRIPSQIRTHANNYGSWSGDPQNHTVRIRNTGCDSALQWVHHVDSDPNFLPQYSSASGYGNYRLKSKSWLSHSFGLKNIRDPDLKDWKKRWKAVLWNRNYLLRFRFRFRFWLLKSYGSGSGSGSNFWKVMVPVPVPTFEKVTVPVPVPVPTPYLDHKKQI